MLSSISINHPCVILLQALNRHQVQRGSDGSGADSKTDARPPIGSLMREASKKLDIDADDADATIQNHSGPSYYKTASASYGADSKDAADQNYEEDFENYDTDENRERSPPHIGRQQSAKGEDYDDFNQDAPLQHYSTQQEHDGPPPMMSRANKTRQGSFKETEPDYVPPEYRSPTPDAFHETDPSLSLQLSSTAGGDGEWEPLWTQGRGFIDGAGQHHDDGSSPTRPGSVSKAGAPLQRYESDTAELAMGPPREGQPSPYSHAQPFTPVDHGCRDADASFMPAAVNQEDIDVSFYHSYSHPPRWFN